MKAKAGGGSSNCTLGSGGLESSVIDLGVPVESNSCHVVPAMFARRSMPAAPELTPAASFSPQASVPRT